MLLTEKEAREKWCPHEKHVAGAQAICIGSRCMAWEWLDGPEERVRWPVETVMDAKLGWMRFGNPSIDERTYETEPHQTWVRLHQNRKGYCGLSGCPDRRVY